jgi:Zn-dependent M28 family amino/carboxypeptidase
MSPARRGGPSEAARRGAIAYLVRSLSTADDDAPHTGQLNYQADAPRIPAAALSPRDAAWLEAQAAKGSPLRMRVSLASTSAPATAWTVLGDIPGGERAGERIIVGGHLDSWDPATGATDDGAGMAIVTAAARLAGAQTPQRTITVVLWGAEEPDFSDAAFGAAHRGEAGQVILIGEADSGADRVWSVLLPPGGAALPPMKTFAAVVAPLSVFVSPEPALRGGADTFEMVRAGVPVVGVRQDVSRYFDWHHSKNDTLDKIDKAQLNQAVAVWASLIYLVANSDVDFRAAAPKKPAP